MLKKLITRFSNTIFWIKLRHWEFWPFELVYFPVFFYWFWLSIKARSFFFFSASNPGIEYSGMLGESKYRIHESLPQEYVPITVYADRKTSFNEVKSIMKEKGLSYPIILKPDIGERGWMVEKISKDEDLLEYLRLINVDFLIQEFLDLPVELGLFYYRLPNEEKGRVTSIVRKQMLTIEGNGQDTIRELMRSSSRAHLQLSTFEESDPHLLDQIPGANESIEIMPIGNHCRGTAFLNANSLINEELNHVIDTISKQIDGFYFGRFDIRCRNTDNLYKGNFKIMELNGAGAEPGHIYHPGASLISAYRSIFSHLNALFRISRENKKRGIAYMTFTEGIRFIRNVRSYNKKKDLPKENTA